MELNTHDKSRHIAKKQNYPSALSLRDDEVVSLSAHRKLQSFARKCIVVQEGDCTDSVYVIHSGKVKVYLTGNNGKEIDLNVLGPGECFGEMILDHGPRSASVKTLEPTECFIIPVAIFRSFVIKHPEFAMRLITTLIHRTRGLLNNVRSLTSLDVHGRVARLLLDLATEVDGRLVIHGKLTKQTVANRIGASREMTTRAFRELSLGGFIEVEKHQITIAKSLPELW